MSALRVGAGKSPLEAMAIEARLAKLGLEIDPKTRQIKEDSFAASRVDGGRAALERLLQGKGELDLDMLVRLPMRAPNGTFDRLAEKVQSAIGREPEAVGRAHLKAYPAALKGAAEELERFVSWFDKGATGGREAFITKLDTVLRRFNHAASELAKMKSSGVLGYATSGDLQSMKAAYAKLLAATGISASRLDAIYNQDFKALTADAKASWNDPGVLAAVRALIPGQQRALAGSIEKILGAERLFEAYTPSINELKAAFESRAANEDGKLPRAVLQYTRAIALNTVQKLFTNTYGNDVELKRLVAEKQRENTYTGRARELAPRVLGDRDVRAQQLDSLRALLSLFPDQEGKPLREAIEAKLSSMTAV